jgi:hypothetical protein
MSISPPIQAAGLEPLPDDTDLVEDLAAKSAVDRVFPFFLGDETSGRFVTAFLVFSDDEVTLYARRRDGESVTFEQIESREIGEPEGWVGTTWDQAQFYTGDDLDAVVDLKERAAYETTWLFDGDDPVESFAEYRFDPTTHEPTGFEECEHVPTGDNERTPNLDVPVSACETCDAPLFLPETGHGKRAIEVLRAMHLDKNFNDSVIRGFRVDDEGPVSPLEEATLVLSWMATTEHPGIPLYARGGMEALVFLVGDQIVAYAGWQRFGSNVLLRALYVLPEYRGEGGLAETVVEGFYDEFTEDSYFVETPNDAAERALARAGHLETGVATPVATLSCRDTTDPSAENAIYDDARPRAFNPVYR